MVRFGPEKLAPRISSMGSHMLIVSPQISEG